MLIRKIGKIGTAPIFRGHFINDHNKKVGIPIKGYLSRGKRQKERLRIALLRE
jgi:hypothetical protein